MELTELHLFDVTVERRNTEQYVTKWPGTPQVTTHVMSIWAASHEAAQEYMDGLALNATEYFRQHYTDVVTKIEVVGEDDIAQRRSLASRMGPTCCHAAVIRPCVCQYSTTCPIHGSRCHGSHD